MIADTSASMWPLVIMSSACRCGEARRADLAAVGLVGAVGDQIDAELALGRLDRGVGLAGRHVVALGVELEVMDQRFHRALHLAARRRRDLAGRRPCTGPARHLRQALAHDLQRSARISSHAHEVAVVAVAVSCRPGCRNPSGRRPRRAATCAGPTARPRRAASGPEKPQSSACSAVTTPISTVRCLKMRFSVSSSSMSSMNGGNCSIHAAIVVEHAGRQVLVHAAGAEVVRVHARAADALVELHQLLALLEAPQRRRHARRRPCAKVVTFSRWFRMRVISANSTRMYCAALRHLDAQQLLDRQREGVLLVHRRDVVEPVEVRHRLQVGLVLDQLLGAAMQQADMRIGALDDLAVHLERPGAARRAPPDAAARNSSSGS